MSKKLKAQIAGRLVLIFRRRRGKFPREILYAKGSHREMFNRNSGTVNILNAIDCYRGKAAHRNQATEKPNQLEETSPRRVG